VLVSAPKFHVAVFEIRGVSPYMQARFGEKAKQAMRSKMLSGSVSKKGAKRDPRDFDRDFTEAQHVSGDGWVGIPAGAFRTAMISACRIVGFKMTLAKLSLFVEADGFDERDGTPLVRLVAGEPEKTEMCVRNATGGPDIRVRPMWRTWGCVLRVRFDADQFSLVDVSNLLHRVGLQVGIGEGRPDSRQSAGLGYGMFEIAETGR
jgi:hypothetical protein